MTETTLHSKPTPSRIIAALRELISALDRRVPHAERPAEIGIAKDSDTLRRKAVARIELLTRGGVDDRVFNQELVHAVMTDDGGPARE